nr:immunoglobulin light chain junction region [Macaca mulatta]MOX46255.1 immunoglobulin light chain junction region [Macaca mulatta]
DYYCCSYAGSYNYIF